jgi:hypothetical protein
MPIFKYFLCVGSLLSLLLFAWCVYLEPPTGEAQGSAPPAGMPEVFRPTPAPPIVEAEQLPVEETPQPTTSSGSSHHVAKVAQARKKQRTQLARRRVPRSFAYYPQSPFFFGWR